MFGCGGDRDRAKRPLMGSVAARLADRVVVTSDNPRSRGSAGHHRRDPGRDSGPGLRSSMSSPTGARRSARPIADAGEGDVVVIAGKGHEQGQTFADRTVPFSDREEAGDALRRLAAGAAA